MSKKMITTDKVPAAIGPYSQAVKCGNFLFLSGQIPVNPETGQVIEADIKKQTKQVLENIRNILDTSDLSLRNVVKITVFITDMNNFSLVNEVYAEYFNSEPPARSCVEVSRLPKDVLVEMEAIAFIG